MNEVRYRDLANAHREFVKDTLNTVEDIAEKYNIDPVDFNNLRHKIRLWSIKLSNTWHRFFVRVVDAKFEKGINKKGEEILNGDS